MAAKSPRNWSLERFLNTDFCPWANRFVYWLKEPVGWFVLAAAASALVGLYVSPIGWLMTAGLTAIILLGLAWPALVVGTVRCSLRPNLPVLYEGEDNALILTVRNRLPIPLWGLAVEGYLTTDLRAEAPNIALACVPPLSEAEYSLPIRPEFRGIYPQAIPLVSCGFPFGIWNAKRSLTTSSPVKVWPSVYPVRGLIMTRGRMRGEAGDGDRTGDCGEIIGVRSYRRGDSLRNIHWIQTARQDDLMVCERGAPQQDRISIEIDAQGGIAQEIVETVHLAQRIRIAASIAVALHRHGAPIRLCIGNDRHDIVPGNRGHQMLLDLLAAVPLHGFTPSETKRDVEPESRYRVVGSPSANGWNCIRILHPQKTALRSYQCCEVIWQHASNAKHRDAEHCFHHARIDLRAPLESELLRLFEEHGNVRRNVG